MTTSDLDHMSDDGLPEDYRAELKNRYGPMPNVPWDIDNAILADARQHLSTHRALVGRQKRWSPWQWAAMATTVAAAAVICVVWLPDPADHNVAFNRATDSSTSADVDIRSDVDQNGRIDILDAFAMARQIRSGERTHDINSDGRFDDLDVKLVAERAVML